MTPRATLAATLLAVAATAAIGDAPELTRGQAIYDRCIACHAIDRNRTGPLHCGLFGRKAGAAPGFASYSDALRNSRIVWNLQTLERFLRDPAAMVPGKPEVRAQMNMRPLGIWALTEAAAYRNG